MMTPHADRSQAEQLLGLAPGLFPFDSRFIDIDGAQMHYIDEGEGPIVLMVHGNPTWSFLFRHLVEALRGDYRCIAIDLAGFGLSRPPEGFGFHAREQTALLAGLLEALDIRNATLIAHDWGGPIGFGAMDATRDAARITSACLGNTWAWPVNGIFHFEWFSKLLGGPVGRWATRRFAIFVNGVMPASLRRGKLPTEVMEAYRAPFSDRSRRAPMHVFPADITGAGQWLADVEIAAKRFNGPVLFTWPDGDIAFKDRELARWREIYPNASVKIIKNCGHYLWEEAPEDCLAAIRPWLAEHVYPSENHG